MDLKIEGQWGIRFRALMKRFNDTEGRLTQNSSTAVMEAIFNAVDRQGPIVKDVVLIVGTASKQKGGRKQVVISLGELLEEVRIQNPGVS